MWLKNGRKYSIPPRIEDLSRYRLSWQSWWYRLQPEWRQLPDGAVSREVPDVGERWDTLCRGGQNGLFMAVLALAWWAAALGEVADDDELCDALDDATWVMQRMATLLKVDGEGLGPLGAKRARDGSSDELAAKRYAPSNLQMNSVLTAVAGRALHPALSHAQPALYLDDDGPSLAQHMVSCHFTTTPRCTQPHSYIRPGYSI